MFLAKYAPSLVGTGKQGEVARKLHLIFGGIAQTGSLLGDPWDLATTYNWGYKSTYNWGNPYKPI